MAGRAWQGYGWKCLQPWKANFDIHAISNWQMHDKTMLYDMLYEGLASLWPGFLAATNKRLVVHDYDLMCFKMSIKYFVST